MSAFKKSILFLHRWLGLISGLVVFIVSITGCLFCFQDELQDAMHPYRKVTAREVPFLQPSVLQNTVMESFPQGKLAGVAYLGHERAAQVWVTDKEGYHVNYINPYTGKVQGHDLLQSNFFVIVQYIHLYLLLPANIGKLVVGTSTLVFVVIMVTGIVLWWPKRKTDRKRSFTIKWNGRWRRVNYDLHNVLGFYATSVAVILAITGMSMSFEWVEKGIYKAGNIAHKVTVDEERVFKSDSVRKAADPGMPAVDRAYETVVARSPRAQTIMFYGANTAGDPLHGSAYPKVLHYRSYDSYQFDQYSGKLLNFLPNSKKSPGMRLNNMNYDIHVGQIAGLPGKIIAFMASLICASLPVTGLIIWLGKRKKPKKAKAARAVTHERSKRRLQVAVEKVKA
jgi:uncharacterized iron-regulated membrane protein